MFSYLISSAKPDVADVTPATGSQRIHKRSPHQESEEQNM
jgi:hypothetical protein